MFSTPSRQGNTDQRVSHAAKKSEYTKYLPAGLVMTVFFSFLGYAIYMDKTIYQPQRRTERLTQLWQEYNAQNPSNDNLLKIIKEVPELRLQAWGLLRTRKLHTYELCNIIEYAPELRQKAWEFASAQPIDAIILESTIIHAPELRQQAWSLLVAKHPSRVTLEYIIDMVPELRTEAYQLLAPQLEPINVFTVIGEKLLKMPELRTQVGRSILDHSPTNSDFDAIIKHVPELADEARKMKKKSFDELLNEMKELSK